VEEHGESAQSGAALDALDSVGGTTRIAAYAALAGRRGESASANGCACCGYNRNLPKSKAAAAAVAPSPRGWPPALENAQIPAGSGQKPSLLQALYQNKTVWY
jgi:hypothetical protein